MPIWKKNSSPEDFPSSFKLALRGEGVVTVWEGEDPQKGEVIRKRFSAFRHAVGKSPLHECFEGLETFSTRTRLCKVREGWWKVEVVTKANLANMLKGVL
jgi:hypothetical protein